jgi:hypothetical protein
MLIKRRLGDASARDHLVHPDVPDAAAREELVRRGDQAFPRSGFVALAFAVDRRACPELYWTDMSVPDTQSLT